MTAYVLTSKPKCYNPISLTKFDIISISTAIDSYIQRSPILFLRIHNALSITIRQQKCFEDFGILVTLWREIRIFLIPIVIQRATGLEKTVNDVRETDSQSPIYYSTLAK